MTVKAFVVNINADSSEDGRFEIEVFYYDNTGFLSASIGLDSYFSSVLSIGDFVSSVSANIVDDAVNSKGYSSFTSEDILWYGFPGYSVLPRSVSQPARSLNSAFQVSTTRDALVSYSVEIASVLNFATGEQGTVFLEYADDSGHTTNVKEVGRSVNGNIGTLLLGLNSTQTITATISGFVPAGKYVKLRTQNNTGTPTFTFRSAQETLL